ncbi:LuxR C-terminal-related transcriptional regulator [Arthrobacter sp. NPDC089319]|uniref:LuxR C-terminal-related transcriptional regulator n=1 Tax=Arthrobacter sp. NPDC089319 TaxID=3155915 RepID=UPI003417C512
MRRQVVGTDSRPTGRTHEVDFAVDCLVKGNAHGILVIGNSGLGKTAFARAVTAALPKTMTVLHVQTSALLSGIPYGALAAHMAWDDGTGPVTPMAVLRTFRSLTDGNEPGTAPPVVVVDDAHFLDSGSGLLLAQLAAAGSVLLLALATRTARLPHELQELSADGLLHRIELAPLPRSASLELCGQVLGSDFLPAIGILLASMSGGNPLLAAALGEHAIRSGLIVQQGGYWVFSGKHWEPDQELVDLVLSMVAQCTPTEHAALEAVALTEPVPLSLLLSAADPEAVDSLETAGLLIRKADAEASMRMGQPVLAEVLRRQIPMSRRISLRRLFGPALPQPETGEELTRSVMWALDCGAEVSDDRLLRAAVAANCQFKPLEAVRASEMVIEGPLARAARLEQIKALLLLREADKAAEQWALARMPGRPASDPRAADATAWIAAQLSLRAGPDRMRNRPGAIQWHEQVRPDPEPGGAAARAADAPSGRMPRRPRARAGDDPATGLIHSGVVRGTAAVTQEALLTACILASEALDNGRLVETDMILQRLEVDAVGMDVVVMSHVMQLRVQLALFGGGGPAGLVTVLEKTPVALVYFGGALQLIEAATVLARGHLQEASTLLAHSVAALREHDTAQLLPLASSLAAYAVSMRGEQTSAADYIASWARLPAAGPPQLQLAALCHVDAARAVLNDSPDTVSRLHTAAKQAAGAGSASLDVLALELCFHAGDVSTAAQLAAAAARLDSTKAHLLHRAASALAAQEVDAVASTAAEAGEYGYDLLAAECLEHACRLAQQSMSKAGLSRLRKDAALALRKLTGIKTPLLRSPEESGGPLTRREAAIADMVVHGATNREIAESLGVSPRTIEGHLYRMFFKLGISRREELQVRPLKHQNR